MGGDAAALEDMLDVSLTDWTRGRDLPVDHLDGQLGGMAKPFEWPVRRGRKKPRTEGRKFHALTFGVHDHSCFPRPNGHIHGAL